MGDLYTGDGGRILEKSGAGRALITVVASAPSLVATHSSDLRLPAQLNSFPLPGSM